MRSLGDLAARPMERIGRAAGAAILRQLAQRVEATADAVAENAPLEEALERHLTGLEQRLVPLLESALGSAPGPPADADAGTDR